VCVPVVAQQQIVDADFKPMVATASYATRGPIVAIDEAHANFYTAKGRYKPFADLLAGDGYRVVASQRPFDRGSLAGVDVLVIADARSSDAIGVRDVPQSAFTDGECDVVRDWVRDGGSLLLVADHAPFGGAAENLSRRFGIAMGNGWTFDRVSGGGITTDLEFSRPNGLLGEHVILHGRNASESISRVRSFAGQSLRVPPNATVLMKLSNTAREAATLDDLEAEDGASRQEAGIAGSYSLTVARGAQALALSFGQGRVVVLGDAAQLSAQVASAPDDHEVKIGMNAPGSDDQQFALNIMHWLSRLLN
jgi:hypothetical protein